MERKQFRGEYLAPNVKMVEMKSRQVLCQSTVMGVHDNPFENNEEEEW